MKNLLPSNMSATHIVGFVSFVLVFSGDNGAMFWRAKKAGTLSASAIMAAYQKSPLPQDFVRFSFTVTSGRLSHYISVLDSIAIQSPVNPNLANYAKTSIVSV
ncbi:unnamed protein product [Colias eurytheme]|nr:unnamed protein product [Colias eurytheme]